MPPSIGIVVSGGGRGWGHPMGLARDVFGLVWLALSGKWEQRLGSSPATPICIFHLKEGSLSGCNPEEL